MPDELRGKGRAVGFGSREDPVVTLARSSFDCIPDLNFARALMQRVKEG